MSDATPENAASTYPYPEHGWTCFHCGETFKTKGMAREHFGFDISSDPACRIKLGAERGLIGALRDAEQAAADAWHALHEESSDIAKAYSAQTTRHHTELRAAEELGYSRGLTDARKEAEHDAARYRYLRDRDVENNFPRAGLFIGKINDGRPDQVVTEEDADAAIDLAMAEEATGNANG